MKFLPKSRLGVVAALLAAPVCIFYGVYSSAQSNSNAPNIAPVQLGADPLYAQGSGQKPTLTLALSVEFPTVGAQYRDTYAATNEYLGYFDADSCYTYSDATNEVDRWFERAGAATTRQCGGRSFSGNFLNWATSSSIDLLRFGLTGGDRIRDTNSVSVLQRAVLQSDFWNNSSYFPQKSISAAIAAGAVPTTLMGTHNNTVYISNCLNRIFFSTTASNGNCGAPDFTKSLGARKSSGSNRGPAASSTTLSTDMFFTRVKVCDSSGNTLQDPRTGLCQKYPSGYFKPVGNMQKYSDRVRLSAFGYLMDNGNTRYGGVLRAPMTYVGPKAYDADGNALTGENPNREWNTDTGVFVANPRNATDENSSGVINYLNMFGRTGSTQGVYKSNDPVGELYYESLRYLQGLQPTPQAVLNIDNANLRAGFPAYSTWTDPFDGGSATKSYACLRNSILLIGDVNTHNDKSLPGNNRTSNSDFDRTAEVNLANNIPNFKDWTKVIGGFESGNSVTYLDGANPAVSRTTTNPTGATNSALWGIENQDTGSNGAAYYLAGAAYWAHTHDIRGTQWTAAPTKQRPGMRVTTYVLDVNENGSQSTAANRYRSQFFLTAKYGGFTDTDGDGNPFTPANAQNQYDNRHWGKETALSEAKTYFLASDAKAVLKALDEIFIAATKVSNTIAAPAASTNQLSTTDGYVYLASFDPEYWSGDLKRNTIKIGTSGAVEQGAASTMLSAASVMNALSNEAMDQRNIVVGKAAPNASGTATAFTWSAIEESLQAHLKKESPTADPDANGENRLNFIRGNRSLEATTFRKRGSRLGDIVNSGVAYSGVPTTRYTTSAYKTFRDTNLSRTKAVFVGANDGMLHAFNAANMSELFAYIPSWMGPKLSTLTATDYNSARHTSYVDATPVVAEAEVGSAWKTVLVSGTGGGGQGVFALDVTNPSRFDASKVLWEFTDANDSDMGNVVGQPKILKLRTSSKTATTATYKWFAVVPSGVNNYVDDGTSRFGSGNPALFLLSLDKAAGDAWTLGTNYFKITLPFTRDVALGTEIPNVQGTGSGRATATGLINFEATGDQAGAVEYFYLGDLHGQFWKINMHEANLSSTDSAAWSLNTLSYFKTSAAPIEARPMYVAKDANGKVQPISMTPTIAYGPNNSLITAFGTGKYLEAPDNSIGTATQAQSFYVLYDNGESDLDTTASARFNGRARLKGGTITNSAISVDSFFWAAPKNTSNETRKAAGWFIDFPNGGSRGGERQISEAVLFGKDIIFTSLMPPSASASACGGGSSYTYTANLASGLGTVSALSTGAQGAPMIFRLTPSLTGSNSIGGRTKTDRIVIGTPSSTGDNQLSISSTKSADSPVGRLNWRQINNYQDLKSKSW